jgi:catechol 2,3-dioxygenase-like lactoylglutathione lyase family enzyme
MQLSAARVFVDDIAQAKAFYVSTLALPLQADGERHGYCVFDAGGITLVVESVPHDAPAEDRALVGRFTGLSFAVADIQATYAQLLARGVQFQGAPERQFWGGTLATFSDPAGNGLQIVEGPKA